MARLRKIVLFVAVLGFVACSSKGGQGRPSSLSGGSSSVMTGLITANQVDISGDDGSLLDDRLNIGDVVYIVASPKGGSRSGWVRISRSQDDGLGFGWVESKNIRTVSGYRTKESVGSSTKEEVLPAPQDLTPSPADLAPLPNDLPPAPIAPPANVPQEDPFSGGDEQPIDDFGTEGLF